MKLILIRHGKTEANEKRLYCGSTDIGLSPTGAAEITAKRNRRAYPDITGMRVITSGMRRCNETLSLIYGDIPREVDPDLREMDFGVFEMRSYDELKNDPLYQRWIDGDNERNIAPSGESGELMRRRALSAIARIMSDGRDSVIVTHGGVIAAVMAHLFPDENMSRYDRQPPCSAGYIVDLGENSYEAF